MKNMYLQGILGLITIGSHCPSKHHQVNTWIPLEFGACLHFLRKCEPAFISKSAVMIYQRRMICNRLIITTDVSSSSLRLCMFCKRYFQIFFFIYKRNFGQGRLIESGIKPQHRLATHHRHDVPHFSEREGIPIENYFGSTFRQ